MKTQVPAKKTESGVRGRSYLPISSHKSSDAVSNFSPESDLGNSALHLDGYNLANAPIYTKTSAVIQQKNIDRSAHQFFLPAKSNCDKSKISYSHNPHHRITLGKQTENKTGLPDNLKANVEAFSGLAVNDVRVHYNSSKPEELQALAYTKGADIFISPGQERQLPHELWHVIQQKQGRVKPTYYTSGVGINDDKVLEKEATDMGEKALHIGLASTQDSILKAASSSSPSVPGLTPISHRAIQLKGKGLNTTESSVKLVKIYQALVKNSSIFKQMHEAVTKTQKLTLKESSDNLGTRYESDTHTIYVNTAGLDNQNIRAHLMWEMELAMSGQLPVIYQKFNQYEQGFKEDLREDLRKEYNTASKALAIEWFEWTLVPQYDQRIQSHNKRKFFKPKTLTIKRVYETIFTGKRWYEFRNYLQDMIGSGHTTYDPKATQSDWKGLELVEYVEKKNNEILKFTEADIKAFRKKKQPIKSPEINPFIDISVQQALMVAKDPFLVD